MVWPVCSSFHLIPSRLCGHLFSIWLTAWSTLLRCLQQHCHSPRNAAVNDWFPYMQACPIGSSPVRRLAAPAPRFRVPPRVYRVLQDMYAIELPLLTNSPTLCNCGTTLPATLPCEHTQNSIVTTKPAHMDPVNAGASVLAFVVLALKSAKVIHEVLSAVKDGPENVRHLVSDVAQLQGILERLSRLQLGTAVGNGDAKSLEAVVKRCADDVGTIESRLQRLSILPSDKRVGKLWKRLVAAIGEKDLAKMQDTVRGHYMMLNVHLLLTQATQMSTSRDQCSEILDHVKELKDEVISALRANPGPANTSRTGSSTTDATIEPSETPAVDSELEQSISRLIGLLGEKESTVASDDAQQMIDDLEALLKAAEKEESSPSGRAPPTDLSTLEGYHTCANCGRTETCSGDLKLIRSLLVSAPSVAVNKTGMKIASNPENLA